MKMKLKMKVEAIRVEDGFLIPFNEILDKTKQDRILLEVEIIDTDQLKKGYEILDELVGFYESDQRSASVDHDTIIYKLKS